MITPPPKTVEWKIDATWKIDQKPDGCVLKKIQKDRLITTGSAVFNGQFFVVRSGKLYAEAADLNIALDILWSWRTGQRHHVLCACDDCEMRKSRRFGSDDEIDD